MGAESPKEECGLFGVWAPGDDVARLTYFGLFAQQHRGQESAGIAVADDHNILVYKDLGLVSQVFNEATLTTLHGDLAVGHTRYSTTGSNTWDNAQPVFKTDGVHSLALGHNGNLVNTPELAATVGISGGATTDTDVVTTMIVNEMQVAGGLEEAAMRVLPSLTGAFCFVFMDERSVYAARDPRGFRPLSIGRLPNGFVVASETCALDIVGATFVRDVEPGEMVRIDDRGLHSRRFADAPRGSLCVFEYVYLARPDSRLRGRTVHEARREMGRRLALESPAEADMVIAVPTTSHSAAQGFSEVSGLPYGDGLYKNNYVGRTFIQPSQSLRDLGVKLKLNPLPDSIRGKRLVVVDDSIVRGTTTKQVVQMLREAGAISVHIRITCPPIQWPCFYGIDMPTRQELIGADLTVEQIRSYVGADSLGYLSLDAMVEAAAGDGDTDSFCTACFDGQYPVPVPEGAGKFVLEDQLQLPTS
jgi:amidophosphoribosyltransferase